MHINQPVPNLFDRIPDKIFRPLGASEHSRRNWDLLIHVYNDFFAPESDPPDGEGWAQRRVTASIERFLQNWDDQHGIDQEEMGTPLNIRANLILDTLLESGWLTDERVGFNHYIIMKPTVQGLLELLHTFAEQRPVFISGHVQSIRNNLVQVQADPEANAMVFEIASRECLSLLKMLNTTRMRVREASEQLREEETPRVFLDKFFGDYISSLYIGDYHDLFSRHHPLTSRWHIIDMVNQIIDEPDTRVKLRSWYRKNHHFRNDEEADQKIEADASRFMALRDVDRLLTRLKDAVTRANDQALGYLEYQVRSQGDFDLWIDKTIRSITRAADSQPEEDLLLPLGWSQGKLLGEHSLKMPSIKPKKRKGAVIQKRELTPEAQARRWIRQIMKGNREVSEVTILNYIERHIPQGGSIESQSMMIESINDLCVFASFSRIGLVAERAQRNARIGIVRNNPFRNLNQKIEIELTGDHFENEYLVAPVVRIRRLKQGES